MLCSWPSGSAYCLGRVSCFITIYIWVHLGCYTAHQLNILNPAGNGIELACLICCRESDKAAKEAAKATQKHEKRREKEENRASKGK